MMSWLGCQVKRDNISMDFGRNDCNKQTHHFLDEEVGHVMVGWQVVAVISHPICMQIIGSYIFCHMNVKC
jgi:hypothetical protein